MTEVIEKPSVLQNNNDREEVKIKDLLSKIQILKNAVIEERNKSAKLEKDLQTTRKLLKEQECLVIQKDNTIINLSKDKYELQSKLDIEKQKNENLNTSSNNSNGFTNLIGNIGNIFQRKESIFSPMNSTLEEEIKTLKNENQELKIELDSCKQKLDEDQDEFEKRKAEYQILIHLHMEKIKKLETIISEKNKTLVDNEMKLEIMFENFKKADVEKTKYESKINEYNKENKIREEKIIELLMKLEEKETVLFSYKDTLLKHEKQSAEMARKLAEFKNAIIESSLIAYIFKCQKLGTIFNSNVEVTFGQTEEDEYVMVIREEEDELFINIEDIDSITRSEKFADLIEICYLVREFNNL
jgi:hypothetical protein